MNNQIQKYPTSDAASNEAAMRDQMARAARRRVRLERQRAVALRDGDDMAPLTRDDLKTLAIADAAEARAVKGKRGAPAIRASAARVRDLVGAAQKARHEARSADLRLARTVALDAVREGVAEGDVLERKRGERKVRLRTRDGLKMLHESGAFRPRQTDGSIRTDLDARIESDRLLSVGGRYRDRYEIAQASLKSSLDVGDGSPRQTTLWTQYRAASRRAALANQVRRLDMAVAAALGPLSVEVLRMVAGEGRTLRSLYPSSKKRAAMALRLTSALRVIADIIDR